MLSQGSSSPRKAICPSCALVTTGVEALSGILPAHAGCQVSKETSREEPLQSHDRTGMRGQPCPRCSGLDGWVGTGPQPCYTLRGALQRYIQLSPTTSQQHGAAFPGETQINILGGPSLEMVNTPNLVQWHFQTHRTPRLTPKLVVLLFPTWTWFHSQTVVAFPSWPWLHSQPGCGCTGSIAKAPQG